jgi:pimeloyl-ACP methyl ester carboxylesterase
MMTLYATVKALGAFLRGSEHDRNSPVSTEATKSNRVDAAGYQIAFTRAGRGPAVALLHGIPTSSYLWRCVVPSLVAAGLEVITLDLLGYGASDKPVEADLGIKAQSVVVVEALRALNWPGGTVVGHDIGGGIAQLIVIDHPKVASRLVLVDSIVYDSFPEPGIARLKDPVWDAILGAPDFDLKKGLTKGLTRGMVHTDRITPEMIETYERPFHGVEGRRAYLRAARALRTEELSSRMSAVEKVELPTLIIWGAEDVFQPLRSGEHLSRTMTNSRFEVIEQAGHFSPEDAPEPLARLIAAFATSVP